MNEIKDVSKLVSAYPNPITDILNIDAKGVVAESYSLYDLKGQLVAADVIVENKTQLSTGNLQTGVYVLKVKTAAGIVVKRIIKK